MMTVQYDYGRGPCTEEKLEIIIETKSTIKIEQNDTTYALDQTDTDQSYIPKTDIKAEELNKSLPGGACANYFTIGVKKALSQEDACGKALFTPETLYGNIKIDGDKLYFSDSDADPNLDGSTAAKRPTKFLSWAHKKQ